MAEIVKNTDSFITMYTEETIESTPHHADIAVGSSIELSNTYVKMSSEDVEYESCEEFSNRAEVSGFTCDRSSYDSPEYPARENGCQNSLSSSCSSEDSTVRLTDAIPAMGV